MTIDTSRISFLPWEFPFNTRPARVDEIITTFYPASNFEYVARLKIVDGNYAYATHTQPYAVTLDGGLVLDPVSHCYYLEKDNINKFGPPNRNWRWLPDIQSR